jgi:hypothetical protein
MCQQVPPFTGHPGARSMGTKLVGKVELENGETVFITSLVRPIEAALRANIERLRSRRVLDKDGNPIPRSELVADAGLPPERKLFEVGVFSFGIEPHPDADDGTFVGTVIDVTPPDDG